jgi:hypothetical protein
MTFQLERVGIRFGQLQDQCRDVPGVVDPGVMASFEGDARVLERLRHAEHCRTNWLRS